MNLFYLVTLDSEAIWNTCSTSLKRTQGYLNHYRAQVTEEWRNRYAIATVQSVTLAEAKQHFHKHTRHVLNDNGKAALKTHKKVWELIHGVPVLRFGHHIMAFYRNEAGHIFARY